MFILCPNRYFFPAHIFSFPNCAPQGIWILKQTSSFSLVRNIIRKHWQQRRQLSNSLHPSCPNKTEIWQFLVEGKTCVRYTNGLRGLRLRDFFFFFWCVCVCMRACGFSSSSRVELHKHFQEAGCSLAQSCRPSLSTQSSVTEVSQCSSSCEAGTVFTKGFS